jgi:hypothetical protein
MHIFELPSMPPRKSNKIEVNSPLYCVAHKTLLAKVAQAKR